MRNVTATARKLRDVSCFILGFTILVTSYGGESNMKMRLRNIRKAEAHSMGTTNYIVKIEKMYLVEYNTANSDNDKLLICQDLVRLYINDGMRKPTKLAEYAIKGLPHATLPIDKCQLLIALGDARVIMRKEKKVNPSLRSSCITPYVQALQVLHEYLHTNTLQKLPSVDRFDGPSNTNSPIYKMMVRQHQEQLSARTLIKQQNQLLKYRNRILKQIEILYPASDQKMLKRDVNRIIDNDEFIQDLLQNS